uniref:Uncharacterized protein n=1 Tax=viral metagenome TaxID=1070528 RepID=A0A6C0JPH9_9ZZZZ
MAANGISSNVKATNRKATNETRKLHPLKLPPLNLSSLNKMLLSGRPSSGRPLSGIPPLSGRHTLKKSSRSRSRSNPRLGTPNTPRISPPVNANPRFYTENLSLDPPTYIPNVVIEEIPLSELERRVRICEEILYIMNKDINSTRRVITNYLNNLVYMPYIPEFLTSRVSPNPMGIITNIHINPSKTECVVDSGKMSYLSLDPNETNFLNKLPILAQFGIWEKSYAEFKANANKNRERRMMAPVNARESARRRRTEVEAKGWEAFAADSARSWEAFVTEKPLNDKPLNVEIITFETISKALFETRLQIHEYEKFPRNAEGKRINLSLLPYTVSPN